MLSLPPARLALATGMLLAGGCRSATYVVQVDAISQPGQVAPKPAAEPQSFKVRPRNRQIAEDSLRYREVSGYIKTALSAKGLYEAPTAEAADLIIEVDYGMEAPRMKYQTVETPVVVLQQSQALPGGQGVVAPADGRVVGWNETNEAIVVYEKYLKVSARENQQPTEGRPPPEVWSVNVTAVDKSNELRKYLPILASATANYIDTNTKQEQSVAVHEGDEAVKFIKKGM